MSDLAALSGVLGDFTVRTVMLASLLLGATSGVLGSFALLREQSLLGDVLSHAALPGIILGFLVAGRDLAALFAGALLSALLAAFSVSALTRKSRLKSDAALGAALSVFFAVGVVLLTYVGHRAGAGQAGLETFLFGQAATALPQDVRLMALLGGGALVMVALFWRALKVMTFDPGFAASVGVPLARLELLFTALLALAIVIGLQLVGVVLMSAMVVAPAAAARQWSRTLEQMVVLAAILGALAGVVGTLLSTLGRGLATGPLIVIVASALVLFSLVFAPGRGWLAQAWRARRAQHALQSRQLLARLLELAEAHDDPSYPVEGGMLASLYGTRPERALARLESEGLVEPLQHAAGEGRHWRLTPEGYRRAQAEREA